MNHLPPPPNPGQIGPAITEEEIDVRAKFQADLARLDARHQNERNELLRKYAAKAEALQEKAARAAKGKEKKTEP